MHISGTIPRKTIEETIPTDNATEAVRTFLKAHPGARVDAIDSVIVRGCCLVCFRPFTETDRQGVQYAFDQEREGYVCLDHQLQETPQ